MELTAAIQEAIVATICYDADALRGGKQMALLVESKHFDPPYRDLVREAIAYIETYGEVPGEHTLDLVDRLKEQNRDKADQLERIHESLIETAGGVNRDYVLAQVNRFVRFQRVKAGIAGALDALDQDAVDDAEQSLRESLDSTIQLFDPGMALTDIDRGLSSLGGALAGYPTGIPELDKYDLGPARKRLHLFIALAKRGKSWWLINLAKQALLHRLRVVYITLELSEDEVWQRMMQSLFSVTKRKVTLRRQSFMVDDHGRFVAMDEVKIPDRPSLRDDDIRKHLRGRVAGLKSRPGFYIRQFPTGGLTIHDLKAYLNSLEGAARFVPDLVIVDYADLMQVDSKNYRHDLGRLYKELRGIAVERNVAIATASQSNREGERSKLITGGNVAEDYSKIATADTIITYSQTKDEKVMGLARVFVAAARTDVDGFTVLISQAYGLGQFRLDSARMVSTYWNHVNADMYGDDEED